MATLDQAGEGEFSFELPFVTVCDEREVFRYGLRQILSRISFVAEVATFRTLGEAVAALSGSSLPSVLLASGAEVGRELGEGVWPAGEAVSVLVVLPDSDFETLRHAATLPASGYLLEATLSTSLLRSALEDVLMGECPMPAVMARLLLRQGRDEKDDPVRLTETQVALLTLMASGATNRVIAEQLGISVHTVKRQVAKLLLAMGCANRTEATTKAMRAGLIGRTA